MMTWWPVVLCMKNFMSSGRCQGRSLSLPITRFVARAAMADTIIDLKLVTEKKVAYGQPFLPFRLPFDDRDPSVGTFKIEIIPVVCYIVACFFPGVWVVDYLAFENFICLVVEFYPGARIGRKASDEIADGM